MPRRRLRRDPDDLALRAIDRMSRGAKIAGHSIESASPATRGADPRITQLRSPKRGLLKVRNVVAAPGSYDAEVLADNPVLYLPLNELSGTVAADITGNGHDGTYVGGPTLGETGPITSDPDGNYAVLLEAGTRWISIPDHADLDITGDLTLEGWASPDDFSDYHMLWHKNINFGNINYALTLQSGSGYLRFYQHTASGFQEVDGATNLVVDTWQYVLARKVGTDVDIFFDAVQDGTGTIASTGISTNSNPLWIGRNEEGTKKYQGRLARFALYDHGLSDSRIDTHFLAATTAAPSGDNSPDFAPDDDVLLVDATVQDAVIGLPDAATSNGRMCWVKKVDDSANTVTITTAGGLIDGTGALALDVQWDAVGVVSNGEDWFILAEVE